MSLRAMNRSSRIEEEIHRDDRFAPFLRRESLGRGSSRTGVGLLIQEKNSKETTLLDPIFLSAVPSS